MDDRQQQIRDRAGLDESRLNQDFIDLMKKYSTPALLLLLLVVGGYAGWQRWGQMKAQRVADAFRDLEGASNVPGGIPSPSSLIDVAEQYDGVGAVSLLARLEAADACLAIARSGVEPGAVYNQDGSLADPDNALLDDAARTDYLGRADDLYSQVLNSATDQGKRVIAVNALFGLASVAESRGEFDQARTRYEDILARVEGTTLVLHELLAKERLATIDQVRAVAELPSEADLPRPPVPAPAPMTPAGPDVPTGGEAPGPEASAPTPGAAEPGAAEPGAPAEPAPAEPASGGSGGGR